MTLLARKLDQLVVMDDIRITILEVKRGYVRVSIEVTEDIKLHRELIYKRAVIESKRKGLDFTEATY